MSRTPRVGAGPLDAAALRIVEPWLAEWELTWCVPGLTRQVTIETSARLRRSLGRCRPDIGLIRINPRLLDEPQTLLREVVCHEVAHVAVHRLHGRNVRPHGPEWARLMREAGYDPQARMHPDRLSRDFRAAVQAVDAFLHRCRRCGASRVARRRVYRWRCRGCHAAGLDSRLEIRRRPVPGQPAQD